MIKKITIIGGSGLIGSELIKKLNTTDSNYEVSIVSGRKVNSNPESVSHLFNDTQIVINLSGYSIAGRWTKKRKKIIYNSRVETTLNLISILKKNKNIPRMLINASGVNIYKKNVTADENCKEYDTNFLAGVVREWEKAAFTASDMGINVAVIRMGVVLSRKGGAYTQFRKMVKYGFTGIIGKGYQHFSFVHINDLVDGILFIIENDIKGLVNVVAPECSTNSEFVNTLAEKLKRKILFNIPSCFIKVILGEGHILLTEGQNVYPDILLKKGFVFNVFV